MESNEIRWNQKESDKIRWNQKELDKVRWNQVELEQMVEVVYFRVSRLDHNSNVLPGIKREGIEKEVLPQLPGLC